MSLDDIKQALLLSYQQHGGINHLDGVNLPAQSSVNQLCVDCMHLLFPGFFDETRLTKGAAGELVSRLLGQIQKRLTVEIEKCLRFSKHADPVGHAREVTNILLSRLPALREILQTDVAAAYRGDPAARSIEEIILAYPCVLVISLQRFAHELYLLKVPLLPRMITEYAHERTGCDLHPGARLGAHFFIDHCTGVVVGETATIGDHVKLYQGVTLGAKSFETDDTGAPIKGVKRHPDIGPHVTIYAHATILGGDTTIGENSIIGSNVWLIKSVPPDSVVYNKGENLVTRSRRKKETLIENPSWADLKTSHDWQI
ncbi:MAG: serine O-acetyltransferase [Opitutus sp.]|nr:serine O-acetyltransferase [Opitutus sp.]